MSFSGLVSEGIYRKEGIKSRIEKLESLFLASSPVHVSREDFTEHDVASALILLFRNLPEPIFTSEQCENWINAEGKINYLINLKYLDIITRHCIVM